MVQTLRVRPREGGSQERRHNFHTRHFVFFFPPLKMFKDFCEIWKLSSDFRSVQNLALVLYTFWGNLIFVAASSCVLPHVSRLTSEV